MKLLVTGATVVALGLLTAGCSSGSGSKAAASSTAAVTSAATTTATPAATTAAPSTSGVATSPAAGSAAVTSSATPTGNPTTAAAQAASSSTATSATTGGTATPVAVCATLPISQVASLSGKALTVTREQDFAADNAYTCDYYPASGVGGLSVTVMVVGGAVAYANTLNVDTVGGPAENVTPVTGIGDKAFSAHDGLHVLFGDRMIYVAGLTTVAPAEAIIGALQAKLK